MSSEAVNQKHVDFSEEMDRPVPGYDSFRQQVTVWTRFRQGTKVIWCPDSSVAVLRRGVVCAESVVKPGFYFIRDEGNQLHLVHWAILSPVGNA